MVSFRPRTTQSAALTVTGEAANCVLLLWRLRWLWCGLGRARLQRRIFSRLCRRAFGGVLKKGGSRRVQAYVRVADTHFGRRFRHRAARLNLNLDRKMRQVLSLPEFHSYLERPVIAGFKRDIFDSANVSIHSFFFFGRNPLDIEVAICRKWKSASVRGAELGARMNLHSPRHAIRQVCDPIGITLEVETHEVSGAVDFAIVIAANAAVKRGRESLKGIKRILR